MVVDVVVPVMSLGCDDFVFVSVWSMLSVHFLVDIVLLPSLVSALVLDNVVWLCGVLFSLDEC